MPNPVPLVSLDSSLVNDMGKLTRLERVTDMDGHKWPITGYVCTICNMPLIPCDNNTTHPTC